MSKQINLYWYKHIIGNGNFGDELNHFIISKLSGSKINRIIIPSSGINYIYRCLSLIYHKMVPIKDLSILIQQFFINDFVVAIGSVISTINSRQCKVWGSGIINKNDHIRPALFYAVRGKYTQQRLKELNLPVPYATGDPAILLPIIYPVQKNIKYKLGIIPNHIQYSDLIKIVSSENILIINLTDPIEKVISEINSCEYTISSSLHGIIVSHAYKIPSLWYNFTTAKRKLYGDDIKFYDYFSSVGIEEYQPHIIKTNEINLNEVIDTFKINHNYSSIKVDLKQLQKILLDSAPFKVLEFFIK